LADETPEQPGTGRAASKRPRSGRGLRAALGFGRQRIDLDESRHRSLRDQCAQEIREHGGPASDKHLATLIQQAFDDYQEQDRRADRAERRAASIQAAVATLLGLTTAGGGLLISAGVGKEISHRIAVAALVIFIVLALILTAAHALATQAVQHEWARPNAGRYVTARSALTDEFEVEMLVTLIAAARHNARIADWKYEQLRHTASTFRIALFSLVLVPIVLLVVAMLRG
jgi:hypothetical protein